MQQQARELSVKEKITGTIVSNSNSDKCKVNDKVNKKLSVTKCLFLTTKIE